MIIEEWKNNPSGKLDIPESILKRLHYKVVLAIPDKPAMICWCERVEHEPMIQQLTLHFVLFDTSQRYQGITLENCRTLINQAQFLGQFTATVFNEEPI